MLGRNEGVVGTVDEETRTLDLLDLLFVVEPLLDERRAYAAEVVFDHAL